MIPSVLMSHPKLPFVEGKKLLVDTYIQSFGLHDFLKQEHLEKLSISSVKRPLSNVAMYDGEDYAGTSRLNKVICEYADYRVGDHFKLSLTEFLDLPVEQAEFVLKTAKKMTDRKIKVDEDALRGLEGRIQK